MMQWRLEEMKTWVEMICPKALAEVLLRWRLQLKENMLGPLSLHCQRFMPQQSRPINGLLRLLGVNSPENKPHFGINWQQIWKMKTCG